MLKAIARTSFNSFSVFARRQDIMAVRRGTKPMVLYGSLPTVASIQVRNYAAHLHLTMKNVHDRIMLVLSLYDKIDPKRLTLDADFSKDLGLDSLDQVEVIMAIEDEFQFEIPDGDADQMRTPRHIYQYICDRKDVYD